MMLERSAGQIAKVANCEPTLQVVPLEPYGSPQPDPDVYYFPKCTRIKQCNGCCNSPLLECTPIEVQENSFTVRLLHYMWVVVLMQFSFAGNETQIFK